MINGFERAIDITTELASGDVNVRALEEGSLTVIGILIANSGNETEDVTGKLMGSNDVVTLNLKAGVIHHVRWSRIDTVNTTTNSIHIMGI